MKFALATLAFASLLSACDSPCEALKVRVCEDPRYLKQHPKDCDLLSDPVRFEALSNEACDSILKSIAKR